MKEQLLKIEELSVIVGVSTQTLNNWYRWKKLHSEHELAKLLPNYIQNGARQTRYWKKSDVWSITEFKNNLPHGRLGILGDITQIYARKVKNNGKNSIK